jgi:hypothetical protein
MAPSLLRWQILTCSTCRTDKAGYYLGPDDNLESLVELMNMVDSPRDAILTVTWEYIPSVPADFDQVKALWFDIGGCGSSDLPAKPDQVFQYTDSAPWTSNFTGRLIAMGGHLHDGGTHLTFNKNNVTICDFVATYGQNPAYIDGGSMSMSDMSMKSSTSMPMSTSTSMAGMNMGTDTIHISSISTCDNVGTIGIGDVLSITAYYNSTEHALMTDTNGTLAPIMGISLAFVADLNVTVTNVNSSATGTGAPSASASKSDSTRELGSSLVTLFVCFGVVVGMLAAL